MNPCNNIASSGVIIVTLAFAFVAAGGQNLSCLIVGMILLDLGNRAQPSATRHESARCVPRPAAG